MLIFRISQDVNGGYDTYSSAIVVAGSPDEARRVHPDDSYVWNSELNSWCYSSDPDEPAMSYSWSNPENVEVELVGVAHQPGTRILCSSFHAG